LRALNAHKAEYLVVGGHAAIAYGVARLTGDIDLWIRMSPANSVAVFAALAAFGAPLSGFRPEDFNSRETDCIQFGVIPGRIDILQGVEGLTFEEAWSRRIERTVDEGLVAPYISVDDLLRNKKTVGRPKDLADVAMLTKLKKLGKI
jgi:hypothetical protein